VCIQSNVLREILNFLVFRMLWLIICTFRLHLQRTFRVVDESASHQKIVFGLLAESITPP